MEKFTKGEWKVSGFRVSCKGSGYIAKALEVFMDKSERTANANLIAAAPEMYAMLNAIETVLSGNSEYNADEINIDYVRKLLSKARGES